MEKIQIPDSRKIVCSFAPRSPYDLDVVFAEDDQDEPQALETEKTRRNTNE